MSDLFSAVVTDLEVLDSLEAVRKAKVFSIAKTFYQTLRFDDPGAPAFPEKAKTAEQILAPLVEHAKKGGSLGNNPHSPLVVFARHLLDPAATPKPLPVVRVGVRIRETHPQAGMPKEVGPGRFLALVLAHRSASNPMRDFYGQRLHEPAQSQPGVAYRDFMTDGPAVFAGHFAGKSKTIDVDGAQRKEVDVPALVYGHWVTDMSVGMRWDTGVSP